jgi:lipopolysaccharide export system protein LptA
MTKKRVIAIFFSGVLLASSIALCPAGIISADEATILADSMRYDPNTGNVTASGNVRLISPQGEVSGDDGLGSVSGDNFELHGNVKGFFKTKDGKTVSITCAAATLRGSGDAGRVITASGNVKITRGAEILTADTATWDTGIEKYSASGNVLGVFEAYSIDADAVSRDKSVFEARMIRRFSEHARKINMSASHAEGLLNENNEVTELTADGDVIVTMPGKQGVVTRATGRKGVYSLARGTVVLSGRATVTQRGRVLNSENIVYFIDSGRIDARGNPSLTFETDRKK